MRGSVAKKGDRYYVRIELDADPATGRRRQKWHSGYRTKREAERARVDLLSKFDRGEYVEPSHQTLADFLEEWLQAIEPTLRPSTFDSYSRNVRNHVIAHIGSARLTKVDAGTLNGLYANLLASGRRKPSRTGRGYSSDVVERALELRATGLTLSATAERLRDELVEADHITKDTLACLLRRHAAVIGWGQHRCSPRPKNRQLRAHDRPPSLQGRRALGAARPQPDRRRRPAKGRTEVRWVHSWDAATLRDFLAGSSTSGDRRHPLWVLGLCRLGVLHVAVRDNIADDEIIIETTYRPDPALWEPDFKTRRKSR